MVKGECQNKSVFQKKKGMYWEFSHPRTGAQGMRRLLHRPHPGHVTQQLGREGGRHPPHMAPSSGFRRAGSLASRVRTKYHGPVSEKQKNATEKNLVNLLVFYLGKAIKPSSLSFSSLLQKSGILIRKSHSANTAAYTPVTALPNPKKKRAARQTNARVALSHPLLFSVQRGMGRY